MPWSPDTLLGDGSTGLLEPFRTHEDGYVFAAIAAWLLGVARDHDWPPDVAEGLLVHIAALARTAPLDPSAPGTHPLLGGTLGSLSALVDGLEPRWADSPASLRALWTRDRALTRIAAKARQARRDRAHEQTRFSG